VIATRQAKHSERTIEVNGDTLTLLNSMFPLFRSDGELYAIGGISTNISDRKHAEAELRKAAELLEAVAAGTTDAVFVKDLSGKYLLFNQAAAGFVGKSISEVIGQDDFMLFDPESAARIQMYDQYVMNSGIADTQEESLTSKGVTRTYLATKAPYRDAQGKVIGLIGISRDISDEKRLAEQVRQSQKLEAIGRLAGGIAHDFNNLLTVINGYAELLLMTMPATSPDRQSLAAIREAGDRAAGLTSQLLSFSRKAIIEPRLLNLNPYVDSTIRMLERLIGEDIQVSLSLAQDLFLVRMDPGQLEQVLMNLSVNARDAMPRGGSLTIATSNHILPDEQINHGADLPPGAYVRLSVSDTGTGMSDEVKSMVFEPFFTTKDVGKGTGLGLATVYGIVKQSGGEAWVESQLGAGTIFHILFPSVDRPKTESWETLVERVPHGSETILLVEDEEDVRKLAKQALVAHGYVVLEADCGASAIKIATNRQSIIRLLVTDVVMPDMGGA